jgi:hypothetical protein
MKAAVVQPRMMSGFDNDQGPLRLVDNFSVRTNSDLPRAAAQQSDTGPNTGARPFLVTLKPNHLPNRADLSRFLGGFDVLSAHSVAGAPLHEDDNKNFRKCPSVASQ